MSSPQPTDATPAAHPRRADSSRKTIEVHLHLPDFSKNRFMQQISAHTPQLSSTQRLQLAIGLLIIIGIFYATGPLRAADSAATDADPQNPLSKLERGTPSYATLIPKGKSVEQLGGWTRISPPERDPVYAYVDTIDSVPISVSQQPLPRNFQADTDKAIKEVALSHNATRKLNTGGTTAYIGASSNGPQSVIFSKRGLLILIKSTGTIPDSAWEKYIQSLG